MVKKISVFILIVISGITLYSQQTLPFSENFIPVLQNKDVFFNTQLINPAYLPDSGKLKINLFIYNKLVIAVNNPEKGYLISGATDLGSMNSSLGLNMEYQNIGLFEHRSLITGCKYNWSLTEHSNINIGLNIGVWQSRLKYSDPLPQLPSLYVTINKKWGTQPYTRLGVSGNFKNHGFGISYDFFPIKIKTQTSEDYLKDNGLIINYQGSFKFLRTFYFIPEVYGCFTNTETYGIITAKIKYKDFITAGFLYNSKKSTGLMISGIIIKRIKIGYFYEKENSGSNATINGLHGLNLGVML